MFKTLPPVLCLLLCLSPAGHLLADDGDEIRLYMQGRYVFQKHCAVCHGKTGRGDGELAKGVTIRPRDFRKGIFKFRTTPLGKLPTDEDLQRTITSGVSGSMMPAFTMLSKSDIASVIVYIKALSNRWDDPKLKAASVKLPSKPDWFSDEKKRGAHILAGSAIFKLHCASCHGETGKGDGPASKGMVDIWGDAIGPADLSSPHHRSGDKPEDLLRTVAMGLDGTPMIGFREILGEKKLWDVIAFIDSLEEKPAAE